MGDTKEFIIQRRGRGGDSFCKRVPWGRIAWGPPSALSYRIAKKGRKKMIAKTTRKLKVWKDWAKPALDSSNPCFSSAEKKIGWTAKSRTETREERGTCSKTRKNADEAHLHADRQPDPPRLPKKTGKKRI